MVDQTVPGLSPREYWSNAEKARFISQDRSHVKSPADALDARRALDDELDAVVLVISSIRARYNALSPVNHLPPETLAHVFHFLRDSDTHDLLSDEFGLIGLASPSLSQSIGWIQVTHVCRQWRAAALEHPALWSNITPGLGSRWRKEFLCRSKMAPIAIRYSEAAGYSLQRDFTGDLAADIAHHLPHVKELSLGGTLEDFTPVMPALRGPAPLLEVLSLEVLDPAISASDMPTLPLDIFGGSAPRIRELTLTRWRVSWLSIAFETLVHLRITQFVSDAVFDGGDLGQLLVALQKIPALETLTLENTMPSQPIGVTPHSICGPITTLPRLRSLRLVDEIRNCGLILKHVIVPATADCFVLCRHHNQDSDFLLPWLSMRLDVSTTIRGLSIKEILNGLQVLVSTHGGTDACHFPTSRPEYSTLHDDNELLFELVLISGNREPTSLSFIQTLVRALPLEDLEALSVSCSVVWEPRDWPTLFGMCNNLRLLEVGSSCVVPLCELFLKGIAQEERVQTLPRLEELTVSGVHFGKQRGFRDGFPEWLEHQESLKKLTISRCTVDAELVDRLKGIVFEVVWDGHLHDLDDESELESELDSPIDLMGW
ncbi:hypothetical protein DENSPDRAFT_616406 [Dentipellis sp. KUC8613]|nr:hypothetical protein DENSPDRAFT_616406 [Dentipellis sp. KUC8613]